MLDAIERFLCWIGGHHWRYDGPLVRECEFCHRLELGGRWTKAEVSPAALIKALCWPTIGAIPWWQQARGWRDVRCIACGAITGATLHGDRDSSLTVCGSCGDWLRTWLP